jgi:hypothetical protein
MNLSLRSNYSMKQEAKVQLDALLRMHISNLRIAADEGSCEPEPKLEQFKDAFETVILPAMEEIGEQLRSKGFGFNVTYSLRQSKEAGYPVTPAEIAITLYLDGKNYLHRDNPRLGIVFQPADCTVRFRQSTMRPQRGGQATDAGVMPLVAVTEELIQAKIISVLKLSLG